MARLLHTPANFGPNPVEQVEINGDYKDTISPTLASAVLSNTVPLSGEMVVQSSINNFLEIERPFYSNRKLISTVLPNEKSVKFHYHGDQNDYCADDVLTQVLAISRNPNSLTAFTDNGCKDIFEYFRTLGPSYVVGGEKNDQNPSQAGQLTSSNFPITFNTTPLSFTERTVRNVSSYRNYVTGPLLEALGSGA